MNSLSLITLSNPVLTKSQNTIMSTKIKYIIMNQIDLYNWNGRGEDYEYRWIRGNERIICTYKPSSHSLEVLYKTDDSEVMSVTEWLNIKSKPNVFTMRITAERLLSKEDARIY